ncbi:MAG: TonB-dependent receptor [Sphingobacteriales bacterium]|nr:TonB-dependent receptor [Sphingobacteriales bacterium]
MVFSPTSHHRLHTIGPSRFTRQRSLAEPNYSQERQSTAQANEIATFIEDDWTIHPNLSLNAGLRYVAFFTEGKRPPNHSQQNLP